MKVGEVYEMEDLEVAAEKAGYRWKYTRQILVYAIQGGFVERVAHRQYRRTAKKMPSAHDLR
jgi:hypothetical protein